jgi:predicted enzyme related to lactoylglutathione lyase
MSDGAANEAMAAVATQIEQAIAANEFGAIGSLFAEDLTWGDCSGKADAQAFLAAAIAEMPDITGGTVDQLEDRLAVAITVDGVGELGEQTLHSAVFVRAGQIVEIIDAGDRAQAVAVNPVGPLPAAAERPATMNRLAAVLPVTDVAAAADHYRALGFTVEAYEGEAAYGFASRDGVELHLAQVAGVDPKQNMSAVYLYVDDADALYAQWRHAGLGGRLVAPTNTDYGLREGAHVDTDGNLLRFGSAIGH